MKLAHRVNHEIRRAMAETGVSQADLHRRLKVSRVTICLMLKPGNNLTLDSLERLAAALGQRVEVVIAPNKENP